VTNPEARLKRSCLPCLSWNGSRGATVRVEGTLTLPEMTSQQSFRSLCLLASSNVYTFPPAISLPSTRASPPLLVLQSSAREGFLLELYHPFLQDQYNVSQPAALLLTNIVGARCSRAMCVGVQRFGIDLARRRGKSRISNASRTCQEIRGEKQRKLTRSGRANQATI
jgi:hypothetical protein